MEQLNQSLEATQIDWQLERKYTFDEVQMHSSLDDCWMVIFDKVYDITDFVYEHPGGDFILLEYAGRDATRAFLSTRHGSSAYKMLDKYWIGILVDEELYYSNNSSYCSVYSNLSWRATSPVLSKNTSTIAASTTTTTTSNSTTTSSTNDDDDDDDDDEDDDDNNTSSSRSSTSSSRSSSGSISGEENDDAYRELSKGAISLLRWLLPLHPSKSVQ